MCLPEAPDGEQSSPSETDLFTKYYNEWKGAGKVNAKNYEAIPRFYFKVMTNIQAHISINLNLPKVNYNNIAQFIVVISDTSDFEVGDTL